MSEVAVELGCDWHTVNDAVIAYGTALVDGPARIGQPIALLYAGRPNWDLLATVSPR